MKKNLQYLFLLLFVVAIGGVLPSCSNQVGYIWDFSSRKIEIEIVDEEGTPLIEPTTHWGDERLKSIQFTFEGESFYYQGLPAQVLRARPEAYRNVGIQREKRSYVPVSYTHLRAHETSVEISYAVFCLKKKNTG